MAPIFRTATLSESKEVARLIGDAFAPYVRALGREWPAEGTPEYAGRWKHFVAEIERGDVHVAVEGGRIVGAARTKPQANDLYIDQIAVDPAQQGTGVGSWMLQRIDELARAQGLGGLSLITAEMAVANIRLYERHGFEIVRRGPADHGLDPHPRVFMVKTFRAAPSHTE